MKILKTYNLPENILELFISDFETESLKKYFPNNGVYHAAYYANMPDAELLEKIEKDRKRQIDSNNAPTTLKHVLVPIANMDNLIRFDIITNIEYKIHVYGFDDEITQNCIKVFDRLSNPDTRRKILPLS